MAVANYKVIAKIGVEEMICKAMEINYIVSNPIEYYTIEEISEISKLAKKNNLVFSIRNETSNFYQGVLISLIKRSSLKDEHYFLDII